MIVYLMRGLPGSGKSTTARTLGGLVIETDRYFYNDGVYRYHASQLPAAREWAFEQFVLFIELKKTPIVLDRGNNADIVTQRFARHAVAHGYDVELVEPTNPLWLQARNVLRVGAPTERRQLAEALSKRTMDSHRVPVDVILERMYGWRNNLTVDNILNLQPSANS